MQDQDFREDPSYDEAAHIESGHEDTPIDSTEPYEPPRIPVGLPHVVQFVEGSLWHMPRTVRDVGEKMSRYADRYGHLSIAIPFLCEITGLGSKNTVEHAIHVMESMRVLKKHPNKGGKDRKSNSYTFLGEDREWHPLPAERRGTDPWIALSKSRRENEELRAELEAMKARMALLTNGHSEVTDGEEPDAAASYESAESAGAHEAIGHSTVTDGERPVASRTGARSYENGDSKGSTGESGAIGHSEVTDGNDGPDYLARRARVQPLVMEFREHFSRSFTRGTDRAVHYFSETAEREQELLAQVETLRADREAAATASNAPPEAEEPPPSGRRVVESCPDCGTPFPTIDGAEYCPECTDRHKRGGG